MSTPEELVFSLYRDLDAGQRAGLDAATRSRHCESGEVVFEEGSGGEALFLIVSGEVELLRSAEHGDLVVGTLSAGEIVGEMAFLDGSVRSTTVRARTPTQLQVLERGEVLRQPDGHALLELLYRNIAVMSTARLRTTTSDYARSLEKELEHLREKAYVSRFLIAVLVTYSVVLVLQSLMHSLLSGVDVYGLPFNWALLALLLIPFAVLVVRSGEPLDRFGVTLRGWRRALFEGLGLGLGIAALGTGALGLASLLGLAPEGELTFFGFIASVVGNPYALLYLAHSYGQEFVARGMMQSSLQRALEDKRGWRSVLLTSFMFGMSHIPFGIELVVVTVVAGIGFGAVYLRHGNLIGVSIVHWLLGAFAFSMSQLPFAEKLAN